MVALALALALALTPLALMMQPAQLTREMGCFFYIAKISYRLMEHTHLKIRFKCILYHQVRFPFISGNFRHLFFVIPL